MKSRNFGSLTVTLGTSKNLATVVKLLENVKPEFNIFNDGS